MLFFPNQNHVYKLEAFSKFKLGVKKFTKNSAKTWEICEEIVKKYVIFIPLCNKICRPIYFPYMFESKDSIFIHHWLA